MKLEKEHILEIIAEEKETYHLYSNLCSQYNIEVNPIAMAKYHSTMSYFGENAEIIKSKRLILEANELNIVDIFRSFNLKIDNNKCICPIHKDGMEKTASFYVYPETNSFHCFGCMAGSYPVDFIAAIKNISREDAAKFLLTNYEELSKVAIEHQEKSLKKYQEIIKFSSYIRSKITNENIEEIEKICSMFDKMTEKYDMDERGISLLVDKLKNRLEGK